MKNNNTLFDKFVEEYSQYAPVSLSLNTRAKKSMIDGGSHALRLTTPFPPRIKKARGAYIYDEDGHKIIDFWQGHFANILGHGPQAIISALAETFGDGFGLQTGFTDRLQIEVAEKLCAKTGMERIRFTTSGTLATQYAILLAQGYSGRDWVMKVGGGWHGGHPWGLTGVKYIPGIGYNHVDSEGIPASLGASTIQTRFNDCELLTQHFREFGDKLACFILEPIMGSAGFIPATREYLTTARELANQYGVVLIFDEVIAGFRFRAGDVGALYGVKPDLITLGKIIGGGMPVAAVAGKQDILEMAGSKNGGRVWFSGGTYSGHPASMLAARVMIDFLCEHEKEVYPYIDDLGKKARQLVVDAFRSEGIYAVCTGYNADLTDSSLFSIHFPYKAETRITCPEDTNNPEVCDLANKSLLQLGFLLQDVYIIEGKGALSTAHNEADLAIAVEACKKLAHRMRVNE
jgi:glutamate-1-semialdehyde 2,1-aminomutase